jgi:hypothetical protein
MKQASQKPILKPIFLLTTVAAVCCGLLGAAPDDPALSGPLNAQTVVERMADRNPTLRSYEARVHVDVRMLNFPYLSPQLDGTSYYKRPDFYEVVFDRMPSYARGFGRLFDDVGSPLAWRKNQYITLNGTASLNGRQMIVLRLTKKIHSDILDHTLAYVDPADYSLVQMEWYYTNGGKITMSQWYRLQGSYTVLSQQQATISIPHVRAVAYATYGTYQTNVAFGKRNGLP